MTAVLVGVRTICLALSTRVGRAWRDIPKLNRGVCDHLIRLVSTCGCGRPQITFGEYKDGEYKDAINRMSQI